MGGTSLQMIADAVGVTKAAIYHQFKTKEQIVIALTERELASLEEALEAAEAEDHPPRARDLLLDRVIDLAVERRGAASTLQFDPVIVRLLGNSNHSSISSSACTESSSGMRTMTAKCWRP